MQLEKEVHDQENKFLELYEEYNLMNDDMHELQEQLEQAGFGEEEEEETQTKSKNKLLQIPGKGGKKIMSILKKTRKKIKSTLKKDEVEFRQ
jgi:hypothetical protein